MTKVKLQRFDLDRLELFSRKENIRIYGILAELAAYVGITVKPEYISVSHRLSAGLGPKASRRSKPIIARCVRRDAKSQVTRHKRKLRENGTEGEGN